MIHYSTFLKISASSTETLLRLLPALSELLLLLLLLLFVLVTLSATTEAATSAGIPSDIGRVMSEFRLFTVNKLGSYRFPPVPPITSI